MLYILKEVCVVKVLPWGSLMDQLDNCCVYHPQFPELFIIKGFYINM